LLRNGIEILSDNSKIALDPVRKEKIAIVTHAHSDHARVKENFVATQETLEILNTVKNLKNCSTLSTEQRMIVDDSIEISFHDAGHILGSVQVKIENSFSVVYTSDFCLEGSLITKPAKILPCDKLIIDATYGSRIFKFPRKEQIYDRMARHLKKALKNKVVVFGCYPIGKAQEVIRFANEFLDCDILLHCRIQRITEACKKFVKLEYVSNEEEKAEILREKSGYICIFPQHLVLRDLDRIKNKLNGYIVLVTGWSVVRKFPVDKAFPLSDHADFYGLLEYVQQASPREVYTMGSYADGFARYLRRQGYSTKPLTR